MKFILDLAVQSIELESWRQPGVDDAITGAAW